MIKVADKPKETSPETDASKPLAPTRIVVLDRGWVYVGRVSEEGENIRISNARNIRRWGTSQGLGELVNGPLQNTVLDPVGEVIAPKRAVIHQITCLKDW